MYRRTFILMHVIVGQNCTLGSSSEENH